MKGKQTKYKTMIALTFEAPFENMLPTIGDVKEYLIKMPSSGKLTWHGWQVQFSQSKTWTESNDGK